MKNQLNVKRIAHDYTMPIFLLCLFIISMIFVPRFAEVGNLINVLMQITINALIATGMTFVILTGGIDLSVGSVAALTGIISSTIINTMPDSGIPMSILVIFGTSVVIGGICGAFNAFNVSQLKVPPFVATLAMMSIARGLAYVFTNAKPVFGMPEAYSWIGLGYIGIIPVMVIIMIIILGLAYLILNRTCFGRYVFAVGSSEDVSQLSGINVKKIKAWVYILCGILSALAGAVLSSRLQAGQPAAANGYELNAIAAVAMGGTSMSGGRGGILQTVVGLCVIGIINNALSLLGVSSYWQTIAMGAIILVAVIFDQNKKD
ncbi:ribose ABC transporter permease [Caproiciproducens galactitolivorans]|uniref:Ribose transport system permease protein RbsC n=1 Tax=Caproiciproducens galactitolivorans TaxID=642589 RepID=A0A4Z0YH40_9FIRM|nr:ribose ABC transporter permease [Caproiciproducens galactitolivorans]QEY35270.1 ribose ABC transporter permease [Caproiciproducens galactitolivorans]TGJ76966.1 ribose transport system permease protein RbsC [Caproiciproducens galactitolivorans]